MKYEHEEAGMVILASSIGAARKLCHNSDEAFQALSGIMAKLLENDQKWLNQMLVKVKAHMDAEEENLGGKVVMDLMEMVAKEWDHPDAIAFLATIDQHRAEKGL